MLEKNDIEFFGKEKVTIFLYSKDGSYKGFVHSGTIEYVGSSVLVINDRYKGKITIKFCDIEEIKEGW